MWCRVSRIMREATQATPDNLGYPDNPDNLGYPDNPDNLDNLDNLDNAYFLFRLARLWALIQYIYCWPQGVRLAFIGSYLFIRLIPCELMNRE